MSAEGGEKSRSWEMLFNRTPIEILATKGNKDTVSGLVVGLNRLEGDDLTEPKVVDTGVRETIPTGLILKSIGYKSLPLAEELPFDHARGIIRQTAGRVEGMPGKIF